MSNAYEALCAIYDRGQARVNSVVRPTLIGKKRADLRVLVRSMSENVATVVINYVSQVLNGGHQQWCENDYLVDDHQDLLNVLAMINGPYSQKVAENVKAVLAHTGEEMTWPYDEEDDEDHDPLGHLDTAFYTYDKEFCQEVLDWIRAKDIETAKAMLEAGSEAL